MVHSVCGRPLLLDMRIPPLTASIIAIAVNAGAYIVEGIIMVEASPTDFFDNPDHPRLRDFLGKVLEH